MAEHLIVVQAVEGSSPFVHPISLDKYRPYLAGVLLLRSLVISACFVLRTRHQLCARSNVLRRRERRRKPVIVPEDHSSAGACATRSKGSFMSGASTCANIGELVPRAWESRTGSWDSAG